MAPLLSVYIQVRCVWVKPQSWHFLLHITWEKILISICAEPVLTCRKLQGLCSFDINENEISFRFKIKKLTKDMFLFVDDLQSNHVSNPCQPNTRVWTRYLALIRSKQCNKTYFLLSWHFKSLELLAFFLAVFLMLQNATACQLKIGLCQFE